MMKRIAFFDTKPYFRTAFDAGNERFGFTIKYYDSRLNVDTVALTGGFDGVCVFVNDEVTAGVIDVLERNGIGILALRCAGYNNVDFKSAHGRLHIVRVPEYSPDAVAEHAAALVLTLNRKTHKAYYRTRESNFTINGLMGFDMNGKTAGIIGTGKIGRIFIRIMRGFGMRVLAFDPFPNDAAARELGFEYVDLAALYRESDIISLHCPLTKETHHIINADSIALMKPGVMIINTGRGQLIETKSLIDGLKSGRIGAAGLDVYEEESDYFFEDYSSLIIGDDVLARLLTFSNVLITSHQGFFTREALESIAEVTLKNLDDYFNGRELKNEVCYQCGGEPCRKKEEGKCF